MFLIALASINTSSLADHSIFGAEYMIRYSNVNSYRQLQTTGLHILLPCSIESQAMRLG